MKIRILFHTPKGERGIGKAIVFWTGFLALFYAKGKALKYNFSHQEIWLPDEDEEFTELSCWARNEKGERRILQYFAQGQHHIRYTSSGQGVCL